MGHLIFDGKQFILKSEHIYTQAELSRPERIDLSFGTAVAFSDKSPDKESTNEDSAALFELDNNSAVFLVADGLGSLPNADTASKLAIKAIQQSLKKASDNSSLREAILDGFEKANQIIQDKTPGSATTLIAIEYHKQTIRPYHVGDSMILVTGQRGKIKLQSVPHSPVGYAVEAGMLDEDEAVHHEERHIVSNVVGSAEMRIEIGAAIKLAPYDTLVISSDGLFDNLYVDEIVEQTRKGNLEEIGMQLVQQAQQRMRTPQKGMPSHADDLSFILFRPKKY